MYFQEIIEKLKKNWICSAILCILAGLVMLLWPGPVLEGLCYVMGGVAIASGVIRMVRYFKQEHSRPVIFQSDLIVGQFSLGLGIFMVSKPQTVMGLVPTLFAIVMIGFGIANILCSVDAKKAGFTRWGLLLALAIVSMLLGYVILLGPFATMAVTVSVIGACLIYEGVTELVTVLVAGKQIDAWRKSL